MVRAGLKDLIMQASPRILFVRADMTDIEEPVVESYPSEIMNY